MKYVIKDHENIQLSRIPSPTGNIPKDKTVRTWYKTCNLLPNMTESEAQQYQIFCKTHDEYDQLKVIYSKKLDKKVAEDKANRLLNPKLVPDANFKSPELLYLNDSIK